MKVIKTIFSRWIIISLLILIQIIGVVILLAYLEDSFVYVSVGCRILSIIILLHIVYKYEKPEYKIPWIIAVLLIPSLGLVVYFLFGHVIMSRKMRRKYQSEEDMRQRALANKKDLTVELENIDPELAGQVKYITATAKEKVFSKTSCTYLRSGEDYFASLLTDLKNAKHFIFLEYFILGKGKILDQVIEILEEKVKEGVEVRVIYDDIGSIKVLPYNYDDRLKKKGIKCIKFNKYRPFANVAYNNRDHRKIVVIDGYIGYTGGINIADEYCNYIERFGHWKDTGIRLYGEAVETLTFMFIKSYNIFGNEKLKYANYGSNKYLNEKIESCGYFQPFGDGPAPIDEYYIGENAYMNMINQATKYLYITTPYLIVDHELSNALCNAALRGVDVRIITPGIPDKKIVNIITKNSYGPLIKAGVKIYEYTPGFIHAKSMIADDKCAIIGTINLDYRSLVHHFECGCLIINNPVIQDIKDDFLKTQELSQMPSKKVYESKHLLYKLFVCILKLFAPLM